MVISHEVNVPRSAGPPSHMPRTQLPLPLPALAMKVFHTVVVGANPVGPPPAVPFRSALKVPVYGLVPVLSAKVPAELITVFVKPVVAPAPPVFESWKSRFMILFVG